MNNGGRRILENISLPAQRAGASAASSHVQLAQKERAGLQPHVDEKSEQQKLQSLSFYENLES